VASVERDDRGATPYLPPAKEKREGIALCLSGGGFRSALFHLGGLRRLNELGVLGKVDVISSVSGGSILSAHLAGNVTDWPEPGDRISDFDRAIAEPIRRFVSKNLRTLPIAGRLLPWNWPKKRRAVDALGRAYERKLTSVRLIDVRERPKFVFCATDMAFGVHWMFDTGSFADYRHRVGDYQAGYMKVYPDWPLGKVVAASSCFPPVFNPMLLGLDPSSIRRGDYKREDWDELVTDIGLADGGVYDNMGLESVWNRARVVLVSDGGAVFAGEKDRGLFWRLHRYSSVAGRQGSALRKRWLIASFLEDVLDGAYWGLGSVSSHYPQHATVGYSEDLIEDVISQVRTDLDAFSVAERSVLENHGYLLADAAARSHLAPGLIEPDAPAATAPHEDFLAEARVRRDLAQSHMVKVLGRW
jgi:NTE family protein